MIISHRGYSSGPNPEEANNPTHIQNLLDKNPQLYVEVDLYAAKNSQDGIDLLLGHKGGKFYEIDHSFLYKNAERLIIHIKNIKAFEYVYNYNRIYGRKLHYFSHESDTYAVTSEGYVWVYPGKEGELDENFRVITLDFSGENSPSDKFAGVCTDFPTKFLPITL